MSSKKVLIISGPTATGKTQLAIKLAKKFNGSLISADSRQVYKGMDIGTGKDHPKDFSVRLIDIISPKQRFSVVDYQKLAFENIKNIHTQGQLPIVVGGSGQYIDSLINPNRDTYHIKPKPVLRWFLGHLSVTQLKWLYLHLDRFRYLSLNNSEQNNPNRLIRKIEISLSSNLKKRSSWPKLDILHFSLTARNQYIYQKVDQRIKSRLRQGLLKEISNLLKVYSFRDPGLSTIAYKEFRTYFNNPTPIILKECIHQWKKDEHQLVKRQKTWYKKSIDKVMVNIEKENYVKSVIKITSQWYN